MITRIEGNVSLVLGERWMERGFVLFLSAKKTATIEEIEDSAKKQVFKIICEKISEKCDVNFTFDSFSIVEDEENDEELKMIPC